MTAGQMIFYSGFLLLAATITVLILFVIKKPRYMPENTAIQAAKDSQTQRLRNGYPTDPLTIHRGQPSVAQTVMTEAMQTEVLPAEENRQFQGNATELLPSNSDSESGCK